MTMPSAALLEQLRGLTSHDKPVRRLAADVVTDVHGGFDGTDVLIVSYVLVSLAAEEADEDCLEAQLNAFGAITSATTSRGRTFDRLETIDRNSLPRSLLQYYDDLMEQRR